MIDNVQTTNLSMKKASMATQRTATLAALAAMAATVVHYDVLRNGIILGHPQKGGGHHHHLRNNNDNNNGGDGSAAGDAEMRPKRRRLQDDLSSSNNNNNNAIHNYEVDYYFEYDDDAYMHPGLYSELDPLQPQQPQQSLPLQQQPQPQPQPQQQPPGDYKNINNSSNNNNNNNNNAFSPENPRSEDPAFKENFGIIFPEAEKMPLNLRNTMETPHPTDVAFFWHIPKSAGQLMKVIMGTCFGLRRAERLNNPASLEFVRDIIVNVDTQTPEGIKQAHEFGLIDSGMVDVITSPHAISASSLFTPNHMGRAFTIMQHPITSAMSKFADRRRKRKYLHQMTLAEYATTFYYPDNWMVRQLTGTLPDVELTEAHLQTAKNILMSKFFVGIASQMEETVRQLRLYYGWNILEGQELCVQDLIRGEGQIGEKFQHVPRKKPGRGTPDWDIVVEREKWDMQLYYIGLEMFSKQSTLLNGMRNGNANSFYAGDGSNTEGASFWN